MAVYMMSTRIHQSDAVCAYIRATVLIIEQNSTTKLASKKVNLRKLELYTAKNTRW